MIDYSTCRFAVSFDILHRELYLAFEHNSRIWYSGWFINNTIDFTKYIQLPDESIDLFIKKRNDKVQTAIEISYETALQIRHFSDIRSLFPELLV